MKKILLIVYCALFLIPCAFFSLGMLIPGAAVSAEGVTMPVFMDGKSITAINQDFGSEFEEYFSKSFAFRGKVVDAFATMKLTLFGEGNEQVIAGRDGFLFFADTLDCYTGENAMTEAEISAAADALAALHAYAEAHGAQFLFVAAPNKNSVYGEMMPARYKMETEARDLDRLYAALDARGVPYLDLRPILTAAKSEQLIYHRRDTHWNTRGALAAWEAVGDALSLTLPDYEAFGFTEVTDFKGDLDTLLFPSREMYDENTVCNLDGQYIFTSAYATPMDMTITSRGAGKGKLLMFRDSFANALIPLMASAFAETQLERAVPYRMDLLEGFDADCIIVEIAERNLRTLIGADERIR